MERWESACYNRNNKKVVVFIGRKEEKDEKEKIAY